jgi:hypothetical protein
MSHLNLWPWRERQKKDAMRRWFWGAACMAMLSIGVVAGIDHALTNWHQQHELQRQQWADELTSLKAALADAPLWQARERQAQQIRLDGQRWAQQPSMSGYTPVQQSEYNNLAGSSFNNSNNYG